MWFLSLWKSCPEQVTNGCQHIVLAAHSRKSNLGFVYTEGHSAVPDPADRADMTAKATTGFEVYQSAETANGESDFVSVRKLPPNIFPLSETNYWFQYSSHPDDATQLVSKASAIKILRMDIRK